MRSARNRKDEKTETGEEGSPPSEDEAKGFTTKEEQKRQRRKKTEKAIQEELDNIFDPLLKKFEVGRLGN